MYFKLAAVVNKDSGHFLVFVNVCNVLSLVHLLVLSNRSFTIGAGVIPVTDDFFLR